MVQSARYTGERHIYAPRMYEVKGVISLTEWEKLLDIKIPEGEELGHSPGQFVELSILGVGEAPISVLFLADKKGLL